MSATGAVSDVGMEDQAADPQEYDPLSDPEEKRVLFAALDSFWYVDRR